MQTSFAKQQKQLEDYVRSHVRLDTPNSSGRTLRQQRTGLRKQFEKQGLPKEQLDKQFADLVPIEVDAEYLLDIFSDLSMSRQYGAMGNPQPFTYLELKAYADLNDWTPDAFELDSIRIMDHAVITEWSKIKGEEHDTG